MSDSANVKTTDHASAAVYAPTLTDNQKVSVARDVVSAAQKHPEWATAQDLQAASTAWTKSADSIEANALTVRQLKSDLRTAVAKQQSFRRDWKAAKRQVLGAVDVLTAGSADELKAWGFNVRTRAANRLPISPPEQVATVPGKGIGQVLLSWVRGSGRHGFVVQSAVDVANPATYSVGIPCTATKFTYTAGASGVTVHFRVAAIDPSSPTGLSAWSPWSAGTAR